MKRLLALGVMLLLMMCSACADTITALAIEVNPDDLRLTASFARVLAYDADSGRLTVELTAPERFSGEEAEALAPGSGIYTGGREVTVRTLTAEGDSIVINADDPDSVWLRRSADRNWMPVKDGDYLWNTVAVLDLEIPQGLIFLDRTDPVSGTSLFLPAVYGAAEFLEILSQEGPGSGFAADIVLIVFDRDGQPAAILRCGALP